MRRFLLVEMSRNIFTFSGTEYFLELEEMTRALRIEAVLFVCVID